MITLKQSEMLFGARYILDPYVGCKIACKYCYIGTSKYGGSEETFKSSREINVDDELEKLKNMEKRITLIGGFTDPYQPHEDNNETTRRLLEFLSENNWPFVIETKFGTIRRDIDIIEKNNAKKLIVISIPTLNARNSTNIESEAPSIKDRLKVVEAISKKAPTVIDMSPIMPGINDDEIDEMFYASKELGAIGVVGRVLELPMGLKDKFIRFIDENYRKQSAKYGEIYNLKNFASENYEKRIYNKLRESAKKYKLKTNGEVIGQTTILDY